MIPNLGDENEILEEVRALEAISIILLLLPQIIINGRRS
jgi:hypothetical protein